MTIALALAAMLVAFVLIWRGSDARVVLLGVALGIGALAGQPGAVFRKTAETLADAKFVLPIVSAMGFAYAVRETGCVEALVRLMIRPLLRVPHIVPPGGAGAAWIMNMAIPSQTSTLASVGPLLVPVMAGVGTAAAWAGCMLVFGSSVAGALLNPGVAEVVAASAMTGIAGPALVVLLIPACAASFFAGLGVLLVLRRLGVGRGDAPLQAHDGALLRDGPSWRALFPPLPLVVLLLAHPSLPTHHLFERVIPAGLEVFTVMVAGIALTIALASRQRARTLAASFEGMGYAFANVITIIAVSAGAAKALEVAGVLGAFIDLVSGNPVATLLLAAALAFVLALISGSGTASSVALITALGAHAGALGVSPLALAAVILVGAEAGRTSSPVAAVLLFGSTLMAVPPRTLAERLVLPCLVAAAAGTVVCLLRFH